VLLQVARQVHAKNSGEDTAGADSEHAHLHAEAHTNDLITVFVQLSTFENFFSSSLTIWPNKGSFFYTYVRFRIVCRFSKQTYL
jgi:hypothetical protein